MRHWFVPVSLFFVTMVLSACAAPQAPVKGGFSPEEARQVLQRQQELKQQIEQLRADLDQVRTTLSEQGEAIADIRQTGVAGSASKMPAAAPEGGSAALDLSPTEVYRDAFADYASGRFPEAIEGFRLFVQNFPDSKYAANAYYWMGESYYAQQDYPQAISAFKSLTERFPDSSKVPEGLFRVAQAYLAMNRPDQAEQMLQIIRERYPKSPAAQKGL